jgi:hypothetical protein
LASKTSSNAPPLAVKAVLQAPSIARETAVSASEAQPVKAEQTSTDAVTISTGAPSKFKIGKKIEIFIHPQSTIDGTSFTLGDIADITAPADQLPKLESLWIGNAPIIGYQRHLDHTLVSLRLRGNGYHEEDFSVIAPDDITIQRASQTITPEQLDQAAISAVKQEVGSQTPFDVTTPVTQLVAPPGTLSIQAQDMQPSGQGYYVTLAVFVDGQIIATRSMSVNPGVGAISVKPGDRIAVELVAGAASVTVQGTVVSHAFLGQAVRVKVETVGTTPTTHQGILVSGDRVEVKL